MSLTESQTRVALIDPQLETAKWKLTDRTQVRFEVPVATYDSTPSPGITDYSLYVPSGLVLAVVEAKRTSRSPREGEEQLRCYVEEIARQQPFAPFGFMANGLTTWFWEVGLAHPRMVAGFFTPADLERLLFIRQNCTPLAAMPIETRIVDRPYQHEAIRRVAEKFATGRRRALLVMATGTGKTRTTMGLIDIFLRSFSAQKILFLADRDALVEQALPDLKLRWSYWSQLPADKALKQVKEAVFPFLKDLGDKAGSFGAQMTNAEFKINKASLLIEACRAIEGMDISGQNQDVQGDIYEYLLGKLSTAGTNGQFRTPRHIIRMMVKMVDLRPGERVCDPAAGTCGFLVNAWQHLLETHTDPRDLNFDEEGWPHGLAGSRLERKEWDFAQTRAFTGYDNDSGMTMLRIGSMNLMLHGLSSPRFHYTDTLSKGFNEEQAYDIVLANPPFKGAIDAADVNPSLPAKCKKTEILFLHLFLRLLENGGRAAVIVPDGVLFGSSNAHVEIRRKLIEENRLDGVVSMPSGVFRPYAGVSTAVLLFTKAAATERIWFYDMEHDGFSLDDKRQRVPENDIPDLLDCWQHRHDPKFQKKRDARLAELQMRIAPLKADRLKHHAIIHRLKFEEVVANNDGGTARTAREKAETELAELNERIVPLENEINQLGRQFWVTKDQVVVENYDLSASRYRQVEQDGVFYEKPAVTLERLRKLEHVAETDVVALNKMLAQR